MFHFENSDSFYEQAFFIALLVRALIFLRDCKKYDFPITSAAYIMLFTYSFFLIGMKAFTFSGADWEQIFHGQSPEQLGTKTVLGGLVLGFVAFQFATWKLKARRISLDYLMVAIPIAMGIQRIGCFTAGCCYGNAYEGLFSVQYDACSAAGHGQMMHGIIPWDATHSFSVIPTQLLLAVGCFLIALFVVIGRRRLWFKRGYYILIAGLFLLMSFFVDFMRAGYNNPYFAEETFGLKNIQWFEFIIGVALLLVYWLKSNAPKANTLSVAPFQFRNSLPLLVILACTYTFTWNWFSAFELFTILFTAIPVLILSIDSLEVRSFQVYKVITYASIVLLLGVNPLLIGQPSKFKTDFSDRHLKLGEHVYSQIDVGYYNLEAGQHYHDYIAEQNTDCNGNSYTSYTPTGDRYGGRSKMIGINYSQHRINRVPFDFDHKQWQVGIRLGESIEDNITTGNSIVYGVGGVSGMYQYDTKWFGLGAGLHAGWYSPFNDAIVYQSNWFIKGSHQPKFRAFPKLHFRVFPERVAYLYGQMGNNLFEYNHNLRPAMFEIGLGSGFGAKNGSFVQIGFMNGLNAYLGSLTISSQLIIKNAFGLNFKYISTNIGMNYSVQFGASYRFGHDYTPK